MQTYKKRSHSSHQQVIVYIILLYYLYFKNNLHAWEQMYACYILFCFVT